MESSESWLTDSPDGRPNALYFLADLSHAADQKIAIDTEDYGWALEYVKDPLEYGCSEEFTELAITIMQENNLPKTLQDPETLYTILTDFIEQL